MSLSQQRMHLKLTDETGEDAGPQFGALGLREYGRIIPAFSRRALEDSGQCF